MTGTQVSSRNAASVTGNSPSKDYPHLDDHAKQINHFLLLRSKDMNNTDTVGLTRFMLDQASKPSLQTARDQHCPAMKALPCYPPRTIDSSSSVFFEFG